MFCKDNRLLIMMEPPPWNLLVKWILWKKYRVFLFYVFETHYFTHITYLRIINNGLYMCNEHTQVKLGRKKGYVWLLLVRAGTTGFISRASIYILSTFASLVEREFDSRRFWSIRFFRDKATLKTKCMHTWAGPAKRKTFCFCLSFYELNNICKYFMQPEVIQSLCCVFH